jgi:hypothetical protein
LLAKKKYLSTKIFFFFSFHFLNLKNQVEMNKRKILNFKGKSVLIRIVLVSY